MSNYFAGAYYLFAFALIYAVTIMLLVVAIAFFTVLERKVLASIQRRRGPNMLGMWGLLQAFADGIKLLAKEPIFVSGANYYIFLLAPIFLLTTSLTLWVFVPLPGYAFGVNTTYSFVVVFLFSALNSFAVILAGLASNSRYSLMGGMRAIAQLISYEIPLSVSLLTLFCIQGSYNLYDFASSKFLHAAIAFPSLMIFFISLLAETNRTPFDLPEAEAELVAGYNLEYSSILFSLFFLAEYSNILLASSLLSLLTFTGFLFYFGIIFYCLIIILIRAILPRYTFAQLISLCWVSLLPASIVMLLFVSIVMFLFNLYAGDLACLDVSGLVDEVLSEHDRYPVGFEKCKMSMFIGSLFMYNFRHNGSSCSALPSEVARQEMYFHELESGVSAGNVILFFIVAFLIVSALVGVNWILVNFRPNNRKNSPYECGFEPVGSPVENYAPNFTAVALIFLIYDVEVLLTFPWAHSMAGRSASALMIFVFFIVIMLLGLMYEVLDDSFKIV